MEIVTGYTVDFDHAPHKPPYQEEYVFLDKDLAKTVAKGIGEWGSDASIDEITIRIIDNQDEYDALVKETELSKALSKLTAKERAVIKAAIANGVKF